MCSDWTDGHFSRALTIDIIGFASLEPSPLNVVWPLTSMVFQWFLKFSRQCSAMVWKTFCHTMCVNPFAVYKWQAIRCPPKAALDDTFFFFIAKSQGRIGCRTQLSVRTAISSASNHKLSPRGRFNFPPCHPELCLLWIFRSFLNPDWFVLSFEGVFNSEPPKSTEKLIWLRLGVSRTV